MPAGHEAAMRSPSSKSANKPVIAPLTYNADLPAELEDIRPLQGGVFLHERPVLRRQLRWRGGVLAWGSECAECAGKGGKGCSADVKYMHAQTSVKWCKSLHAHSPQVCESPDLAHVHHRGALQASTAAQPSALLLFGTGTRA